MPWYWWNDFFKALKQIYRVLVIVLIIGFFALAPGMLAIDFSNYWLLLYLITGPVLLSMGWAWIENIE